MLPHARPSPGCRLRRGQGTPLLPGGARLRWGFAGGEDVWGGGGRRGTEPPLCDLV